MLLLENFILTLSYFLFDLISFRAEIQKYFCSIFGSSENSKFAIEINWSLAVEFGLPQENPQLSFLLFYVMYTLLLS